MTGFRFLYPKTPKNFLKSPPLQNFPDGPAPVPRADV